MEPAKTTNMSKAEATPAATTAVTADPPKGKDSNNKGKGKGGGKTNPGKGKVSTAPKNLAFEVPTPKHLSVSSSELKNDPALQDAYALPSGPTYVPLKTTPTIQVSLAAFPQLVEASYTVLAASDKDFAASVSRTMYAYYCHLHLVARIVAIKEKQGNASYAELQFREQMRATELPVPAPLDPYLRSLGEFKVVGGTRYQCIFPDYDVVNWGQVTADTVANWCHYPHVYTLKIRLQQDILKTETPGTAPNWDFPQADNIAPAPVGNHNPGHPTANLLGWAPSSRLSRDQDTYLSQMGITNTEFPTRGPVNFGFNPDLVEHVAIRLRNMASQYSMAPGPHEEITGSAVQANFVALSPVAPLTNATTPSPTVPFLQQSMARSCGVFAFDTRLAFASLLYALRVRTTALGGRSTWSPYYWDHYTRVPQTWQTSMNNFFSNNDNSQVVYLNNVVVCTNYYDRVDFIRRIASHSCKKAGLY